MNEDSKDNCSTKIEDFLSIIDTDTGEVLISQRGNLKSTEEGDEI